MTTSAIRRHPWLPLKAAAEFCPSHQPGELADDGFEPRFSPATS
jgi:hypothetical protein